MQSPPFDVSDHAHTPSTRTTSLMRVKIACTTFVYDTCCVGHWNKENERKN